MEKSQENKQEKFGKVVIKIYNDKGDKIHDLTVYEADTDFINFKISERYEIVPRAYNPEKSVNIDRGLEDIMLYIRRKFPIIKVEAVKEEISDAISKK